MDNFEPDIFSADAAEDGILVEANTEAFALVYARQAELQDLLDDGGDVDDPPEVSLAAIKNAGQLLLDALNALSLEDFNAEFEGESEGGGEGDGEGDGGGGEDDPLDSIFEQGAVIDI